MNTKSFLFVLVCGFSAAVAGAQAPVMGPEFQVNTSPAGYTFPHLAADASGNFVVVWDSRDGVLLARRFDRSGTPLGDEFRVNAVSHGLLEAASAVAMNRAGDFVVLWTSFARLENNFFRDMDAFARRFDSVGNALGGDLPVNAYTTGDQHPTGVAIDAAGDFVVVWESTDQDGSGRGVFGRQFDGSGVPRGPEFQVNTYTTGNQSYPGVAMDGEGGFVVAWNSDGQDGSGLGVFGRRYNSFATPVSEEFPINSYTTGKQYGTRIVSTQAGDFFVAWTSDGQDGSDLGVFARQFDSFGAPLAPEFQINTYTSGPQDMWDIGIDSSGDFVVVWQSLDQDGDGYGVFGRRFGFSGRPMGSEFQVNEFTVGFQGYPSVGLSEADQFPVAWLGQTESGSAVFARIGLPSFERGEPLPLEGVPRTPRAVPPRPVRP